MRRVLPLCLILCLLAACESEPDASPREGEFRVDGTLDFLRPDGSVIRSINIEVADDAQERHRGLMFRRQMTLEQGMLFLFDDATPRSFWMENTYIPLDIIFVSPDAEIINIARSTRPLSRDTVSSAAPAQYVVEVRGGFSERFGLTDSTRIRWTLN